MPTTVTKTLKSTGGDYTSFAAWQAAQAGDITAAGTDEVHVLECYKGTTTTGGWQADGSLIEQVDINGWTTDATHTVTVKAGAGEEHGGTIGAGFVLSYSGGPSFDVSIGNVELYDIEIANDTTAVSYEALDNTGTQDVRRFERLIVRQESATSGSSSGCYIGPFGPVICRNNLFVSYNDIALAVDGRDNGGDLSNNTVIGRYNVVTTTKPDWDQRNNVFYGDVDTDAAGTGTNSHNAFSGTGAFGTNQVTTLDSTDFEDFANDDYRPASGGDLIDAGTDLSGTFTDDIAGNTRG